MYPPQTPSKITQDQMVTVIGEETAWVLGVKLVGNNGRLI